MINIKNLLCEYPDGAGRRIRALSLEEAHLDNDAWALIGPSGSGKTTLLHTISGLVTPTAGSVVVDGRDVAQMSEAESRAFRAREIGYIFQKPRLLPYLTVEEHMQLSCRMSGKPYPKEEAAALLEALGLAGYERRNPSRLSGGEAQRVSFLTAIIRKPRILLADEPTASLDKENTNILMTELLAYQRKSHCLLLVATHDESVQGMFGKKLFLKRN